MAIKSKTSAIGRLFLGDRGQRIRTSVALAVIAAIALISLPAAPAIAGGPQEAFDKANMTGTFVLFDVSADKKTLFNAARAEKRFAPASTFKITNSLIALETEVVSSVDEVISAEGNLAPDKPWANKAWEKDMSMREGIKISNVLLYQKIARSIGPDRMHEWVCRLGYGNADIGSVIDRFWIDGPLAISPVEQTQFLARLAQQQLPASRANQLAVRDILLLEETDTYRLYGKTGWDGQQGWWVGWVERDDRIYTFAVNVDMTDINEAPKRLVIGKEILRHFEVLP